jgi:hypothetical protein
MVGTAESSKDTVQHLIESAVKHVGGVAVIATTVVVDVVREIGGFAAEALQALQGVVESAVDMVGKIALVITTAIADIVRELGDWVTEGFEMVEASKAAQQDRGALGMVRPNPAQASA